MAKLPANLAPKYGIELPATFGAGGGGLIGVVHAGWIKPVPPPGARDGFVSLTGVSFPIGAI